MVADASGGTAGAGATNGTGGTSGDDTSPEGDACACHVIRGDPAKTATELALFAALTLLGLRRVRPHNP